MDLLPVPRASGIQPCPSFHSPLSSSRTSAGSQAKGRLQLRVYGAGSSGSSTRETSQLSQESRPAFRPRSSDEVQMTAQPLRPSEGLATASLTLLWSGTDHQEVPGSRALPDGVPLLSQGGGSSSTHRESSPATNAEEEGTALGGGGMGGGWGRPGRLSTFNKVN